MGRPRTPTALKLLKGTDQPCRTNPGEPSPDRGIPDPPEHLSDRALKAWPGVAGMLDGMGVLTLTDALVLEGLCETYAELVEARLALRARGALSYCTEKASGPADLVGKMDDAGEIDSLGIVDKKKVMWRMYPEVAMIAELDRRFAMWLAKVGLTPADRSRVSAVGGQREENPWDAV